MTSSKAALVFLDVAGFLVVDWRSAGPNSNRSEDQHR
jgi:hypothetical protein